MPLEVTASQLAKLWDGDAEKRAERARRWDYYCGKHKILERDETYSDKTPKSNIVTNWPRYIVNRYIGALTSTPYQLAKLKDDTENAGLDTYQDIEKANRLVTKNVVFLRDSLVQGFGLELHLFVKDQGIRIRRADPSKWTLIYDSNDDLVGALTQVVYPTGSLHQGSVLAQDLEIMTLYDDVNITDYSKGKEGWGDGKPTPHGVGRIPVVVHAIDEDNIPLLTDDLLKQCDEYNEADSASGDKVRQLVDNILKLWGYDPDWVIKNGEKIRTQRVLPLEAKDTHDAEYLEQSTDTAPYNERILRTREHIHIMGEVPDFDSIVGATGSTSGIALRLKFLPMDQRASSIMNYIRQALDERIDLINARHDKLSKGTIQDYKHVIQFSLPANRIEEWNSAKNLVGILAVKRIQELLSDVDDPDREWELLQEEMATALSVGEGGVGFAPGGKTPPLPSPEAQLKEDDEGRAKAEAMFEKNMSQMLEQLEAMVEAKLVKNPAAMQRLIDKQRKKLGTS